MYRIFCESYENFINSMDGDNYRIKIAEPFLLIINETKYKIEKKNKTDLYKKVSDLIYFMSQNVNRFPKVKAFLWTLESRDMKGQKFDVSKKEELEEQTKLVNSFLKLAYWY